MPVDVVGDKDGISVFDLKLQKTEDFQKFSLSDIPKERYKSLRKIVKTNELGENTSLVVATFMVATGMMGKGEVPDYTKLIKEGLEINKRPSINESSAGCARWLFQAKTLYPDKLPEFLNKDDYYSWFCTRINSFSFSHFNYQDLDDFIEITRALGLLYPEKVRQQNLYWHEPVKKKLEDLMEEFQGRPLNCLIAASYRIIFPEDDGWKKYFPSSHWDFLKENLSKIGDSKNMVGMALSMYIVSADQIKVTDKRLVIENNKTEKNSEQLIPERRKY